MKKLLLLFRLCLYYIVGILLFTTLFTITELYILKDSGMNLKFFSSYITNFSNNLLIYTLLYFILIVSIRIYDILSVKKLNEKLQKMKKGVN